MHESTLSYYAAPGPMTDPGEHAARFDALPTAVPALVEEYDHRVHATSATASPPGRSWV